MNKLFTIILILVTAQASAQKYSVAKSTVSFYSDAPLEEIRAENKKSRAILDLSTSQIALIVPISEFQFKKKLMQEHFNEKYMETEKYPNATFQGIVLDLNPDNQASQSLVAKGELTIHGVTQEVEIPGNLTVSKNGISIKTVFTVKLEDYEITIPQLLWQNIAEEVEVTFEIELNEQS